MTKIELWDTTTCGVIFPEKTGMLWSNQCGGVFCSHPEIEGFFVPLGIAPLNLWEDIWAMPYEEYVKEMEKLEWRFEFFETLPKEEFKSLVKSGYNFIYDSNEIERYGCGEAWIPVKIKQSDHVPVSLKSFIGKCGIFTYPNSD